VEIYVSTDVETDGPIPGPNSMLSFGSAAYTAQKELIGTFSANLETDYRESTKNGMPRRWFDQHPHSHIALDDAIEQGALFCNMLAENLREP
jgi:hypothetical protein